MPTSSRSRTIQRWTTRGAITGGIVGTAIGGVLGMAMGADEGEIMQDQRTKSIQSTLKTYFG